MNVQQQLADEAAENRHATNMCSALLQYAIRTQAPRSAASKRRLGAMGGLQPKSAPRCSSTALRCGQHLQLLGPLAAPVVPQQLRANMVQALEQAQIPGSVCASGCGAQALLQRLPHARRTQLGGGPTAHYLRAGQRAHRRTRSACLWGRAC